MQTFSPPPPPPAFSAASFGVQPAIGAFAAFGAAAAPAFGAAFSPPPPPAFGAAAAETSRGDVPWNTSALGAVPAPAWAGQGTLAHRWTRSTGADTGGLEGTYISITHLPQYRDFSFEELRLQDYEAGYLETANCRGLIPFPPAFGAPAGGFSAPAAGGFGTPATGGFGAPAAPGDKVTDR